jgi:hypothetical protein
MSTIKSSAEDLTLNADGANNDVIIQSNGSTKVTLDGSGKLGIGTTGTPNRMLTIEGDGNEPDISLINLDNTNNNYNEIRFLSVGSDDSTRRQGAGIKAIYTNHNSQTNPVTDLSFETRNAGGTFAERMRIQADGSLLVGTTDGGSSGVGDIVASAVFLGGNQAANELDDYEEGTWTPNIYNTGHSAGAATTTGVYTKVGRLVTCFFRVDDGVTGGGTGALKIAGLPFAPSGMPGSGTLGFCVVRAGATGGSTGYRRGITYESGTEFNIMETTAADTAVYRYVSSGFSYLAAT